jgi:hypothetical protein
MKKKIYVGCALTNAPEEFKQKVEDLKNKLRQSGHEVFDFIGTVKGTPKDVYNWDIKKCVAECDLFIAILEYQSIGLGYELAAAVEKYQKPVLALIQEDQIITRLALGIEHPLYTFRKYQTLDQAISLIEEKIAAIV